MRQYADWVVKTGFSPLKTPPERGSAINCDGERKGGKKKNLIHSDYLSTKPSLRRFNCELEHSREHLILLLAGGSSVN